LFLSHISMSASLDFGHSGRARLLSDGLRR
jgi:hypothetical protein